MARGKFRKQKKRAPLWFYAAVLILVGIFVFCAWYLADYILNSQEQAAQYEDLAALVDSARQPKPTVIQQETPVAETEAPAEQGDPEEAATVPTEPEKEKEILPEYVELLALNPDVGGWISIEGTKVNYPVMHTPGRPDYYLKRNFSGAQSTGGCLYAREDCDLEEPSDNVTIYGHNMKNGSMFGTLRRYTKKSFWEEHRYVRFDTMTEHHTYEIFAVFKTTASEGKGFEYHNFINAADEADFDEFIAQCLSLSLYDTEIVPQYGDKIICLSTCEYTQTNGRLVVVAVRIE